MTVKTRINLTTGGLLWFTGFMEVSPIDTVPVLVKKLNTFFDPNRFKLYEDKYTRYFRPDSRCILDVFLNDTQSPRDSSFSLIRVLPGMTFDGITY